MSEREKKPSDDLFWYGFVSWVVLSLYTVVGLLKWLGPGGFAVVWVVSGLAMLTTAIEAMKRHKYESERQWVGQCCFAAGVYLLVGPTLIIMGGLQLIGYIWNQAHKESDADSEQPA